MDRLVISLSLVTLLAIGPASSAHPTRAFRACTVHVPRMCIPRGAVFHFGDRVKVRGVVVPAHAGADARVLRQDPHSTEWHRVGTVTVSDQGRMRFTWRTRRADAVQDAPYRFRFRIPGHGRSNATEALVLFGE
jgi:hypothetical protein